jgi:hypothetical protein
MGDRSNQELAERLIDGYMQYDYTETWQVTASGISAALLDADLPRIGQEYAIVGISAPVYCYQRVPRRRSDTQAKNTFDVVCSFTNAINRYERTIEGLPASTPEEIAPRLEVTLEEFTDEHDWSAHLCGITEGYQNDPTSEFANFLQPPPYFINRIAAAPSVDANTWFPQQLVNSADDVIGQVTRRSYRKKIVYWTWHRNWSDGWEDWIDCVNTDDVVMTQYDKDGLRMKLEYGPYELMCSGVIKEDHWRDGRLWFRRGVQLNAKRYGFKWFDSIKDEGYNEMLWEGQFAGKGNDTLTRNDITTQLGESVPWYAKKPIALLQLDGEVDTPLWVAPSEPVALNGHGLRFGYSSPSNIVPQNTEPASYKQPHLCYLKYRPVAFAPLDLK